MMVREEPLAGEPASILEEILRPFDLATQHGPTGSLLIVRREARPADSTGRIPGVVREPAPGRWIAYRLETVVVTASRYALMEPGAASPRFLPRELIEALPKFGDDPVRAVARLPGAATGGFTAHSNIRGGERNDTLVLFDDLRLRNPFHLKDFQSIFSAINPAIIDSMEVYTGAVPPRYGDRMSGVIEIRPVEIPYQPRHEISQSLFNSSLASAGTLHDGQFDWVAAVRRGNLDLVLDLFDSRLGAPSYLDLYGRFGVQASDRLRVTGNVLAFHDHIRLSDSDQEENASGDYRDEYFWLRLEHDPGDGARGYVLIARSQLSSHRQGDAAQSGIATGQLDDRRSFTIDSLKTHWSWWIGDRLGLSAGGETSFSRGRYDFRDTVDFDVLFDLAGTPTERSRSRAFQLRPRGEHHAAYLGGRWAFTGQLAGELGLRWDKETLTAAGENQFSPRIGLVYDIGPATALRASWGRQMQSQGIDELQIADGITGYFRPQRADHVVLSLEHRTTAGVDLRVEAYEKKMSRLRPRFENLLNNRILLPELKPDRIRLDPQDARARGVEFSAARHNASPLGWWFGYTWARVEDEFADGTRPRSWDQAHAIQAGLDWRHGSWRLAVAGNYHSGWPTTEVFLAEGGPLPTIGTETRNADRLGDFQSIDLRLSREWRFQASDLTVFLELSNAFNRRNDCCVEYEFETADEDEDEEEEDEVEPALDLTRLEFFRFFPSLGFSWRF
jgi:outer membrane receptor protein involved in Fe transport